MRVIPPEVVQPQATDEKPQILNALPYKEKQKENNNGEISVVTAPSTIGQSIQEAPEIQIRKKAQYRAFMKLIKDKKYTSAILSSRAIGVDKNTITLWLQTKAVRDLMQSTYSQYIDKIAESKQWQAQAYLLDKLEDKDNTTNTQVTLNNLIQINV